MRRMAAAELRLPTRYGSVELIASGGMADVYRATDHVLDRTVAIKVLSQRFAADPETRERFTREALTAARLSGIPEIATIYDVGDSDGVPFIVMEHLGGGSLADLVRQGPVQPTLAAELIEQAARALDAAHVAGVVHRDVKPANLLLDEQGAVHVADFGVANAASFPALTLTGTILGTSGYLAPEQARGERATPASDRYALAVVAFELLTGRRPYVAASFAEEASAHVHAPIPRASDANPRLPAAVDAVLARGMAKAPGDRYPTALAFAHDLAASLASAPEPAAATTRVLVRRRRRSAAWVAAAAALLGAAAAGIVAAVLASGGGPSEATRTIVRTRTVAGAPQTRTVTVRLPGSSRPATSAGSSAAGGESGAALNDRGYALMQRGDYQTALPLLEQAVQKLAGTRSLAEAYALYNLAYTRLALGSCDGVLDLLDTSESIQGKRHEIDRLRHEARKACEE